MTLVFKTAAVCGLVLGAAAATPSFAHHSASMFDFTKSMTLEGTIKEFNWSNPHISLDLVADPKAGVPSHTWTIEASSTGVMSRAGWSKRSLNPGDKVTVSFFPLRDGGSGGSVNTITFPNGKVLAWLSRPSTVPAGGL